MFPARIIATSAALLVLAACAGPPTTTDLPEVSTPDAFVAGGNALAPAGHPDFAALFGAPELEGLIAEALANNPSLRVQTARVAESAALLRQAGATRRPSVDMEVDGGRGRQVFTGMPLPGAPDPLASTSSRGAVGVRLSWEIDLAGRLAALEAAQARDHEAELALEAASRLALSGAVARAHFGLIEAREQVALLQRRWASARRTTELALVRVRVGVAPPSDADLAESAAAAIEAAHARALEQVARLQRAFEVLLGRYPSGTELPGSLPTQWEEPRVGVPADLVRRREDLRALERRLAAAGAREFAARRAFWPTLRLGALLGLSGDEAADLIDPAHRMWDVGAGLVAPLFSGDLLDGALARDVARREALEHEYVGALLRAFQEVETALATRNALAAQEAASLRSAAAAERALQRTRARYSQGVDSLITVLDAERRQLEAEGATLRARRDRIWNRIELDLALGGRVAEQGG